jgi:dethiobiotin synthetase
VSGVFVTGTDTGVGKTFVAASLAAASLAAGYSVRARKPLLSGLDDALDDGVLPDHVLLEAACGAIEPAEMIAPITFGPSVSPHLAAAQAGVSIDISAMLSGIRTAGKAADRLIVEGAGGWRVPITGSYGFRELAVDLSLPVVVAARPGLGTINHSLLTIESVRASGLDVRCVVFGPWPQAPCSMELDNIATVERLGDVAVATLPLIDHLDPEAFAAAGAGLPLDEIFRS